MSSNAQSISSCGGEGNCATIQPPKPPQPDPNPADSTNIRSDAPVDPNEIIGPDGWMAIAEGDTVRWVSASESLPYTIYFENDPERATAAAQVVTVRLKLHPLMNMADFGIGTFGFGNHVFPVEGSPLQYQTRLDLTEEMNLYVDVVAGIDITTNEAFWIFSSIDPATGVAPTETDRGFLAVNDSTHAGEGYVTFTIKPKANLCHTGDTLGAQASIVFDINDPIQTNRWVNTIDAVAPTSSCRVLEGEPTPNPSPEGTNDSLRVVFSGTDDTTGIAAYRLYYTENGSAFRLAGRYSAGDTAVIAKQPNITYTFFSLGEDNVGNMEPLKNNPDTLFGSTLVSLLASVTPAGSATIVGTGSYAVGDTAHLVLHPAEGYTLARWTETGIPQGTDTLLTLVADQSHTLVAEMERIGYPLTINVAEGTSIALTIHTISGETHSYPSPEGTIATYEARHFDTLNIHIESSPCYSNVTFSLNGEPLTSDTTIIVRDSVHLSSIATAHTDTGYVYDTVCPNTAYTANGFNILSSATQTAGTLNFQLSILNSEGCDSIAVLNLTVKPSHTLTFLPNGGTGTMPTQRVCSGEDVVLSRSTFTREGYYFAGWAPHATDTTPLYVDGDIANFDSDQALYAVWSNSCVDRISSRIVTACDNYTWFDSTYTSTGEYTRTRPSVLPGGCDSIYRLHLTVNHSTEALQHISTCHPYTWIDGQTYATDTVRQISITNAVGCDSLVTLQLTINYNTSATETVTACDSYTWHDSVYTASTLNSQFSTLNSVGCDSVTTLHLTVNYSNTGTEIITACDSYTWHDSTYTASTLNSQFSTLNSLGCDSTVTLHLTINHSSYGIVTVTACDSYTWHDSTYTSSTNAPVFTTTNSEGCDSLANLRLTIHRSSATPLEAFICQGDSIPFNGGWITQAGVYADTLQNRYGCDSVLTLSLTLKPVSDTILYETACDSYTWLDSSYTLSTTVSTTGTNQYGCDSTVTLHLTINYSSLDTVVDTGVNHYEWQGNTYTESGEYLYEGQTEAGCDSIIVLQLTITEVGISTIDSLGGITLYPNPTTGKTTIAAEGVTLVEVFDPSGRIIATFHDTNVIDLSHLPTGAYTLRIRLHNGTAVKRVVKQ